MRGPALALAAAAVIASRLRRRVPLRGRTALVCGGSRGLGLAVACELARRGCRVAIAARTAEDLERARDRLERFGGPVLTSVCDLRDAGAVESLVADVSSVLGPIEILVANAATITVAPLETLTAADFDDAMRSIFSTSLHASLAVSKRMRARRSGTIAFVTSIGGVVAVPHLAPYCAAKFAEVGLSEAMRAELAKDGVRVLTVVPGLMRTGSWSHARFRGDAEREYTWFGAGANAPILSIDADRAARRIVRAIETGRSAIAFTPEARLARRVPGLVRALTRLAARLLPEAPPHPTEAEGRAVEAASASSAVAAIRARTRELAPRYGQ